MSGTSLDGLDIAAVEFLFNKNRWSFSLHSAKTIEYTAAWKNRLQNSPTLSGAELVKLHADFGRFIGEEIQQFTEASHFTPDIIASHGHTIFHQPENGFTFQAGDGNSIAAATQTLTVADFRSQDIALGGQGAPLVPAGDQLLFSEYDFCLNLGGFANISFEQMGNRIAFDICPVNFILNDFAGRKNLPFDKNGDLGRKGKILPELLEQLNQLNFYEKPPPKSLGREWMEREFKPVIQASRYSFEDQLRTVYEHIAYQISKSIAGKGKLLITGGGTFNRFLIERIGQRTNAAIEIPSTSIINYKEALIFAFLGVLRIRNEINCFASVTGACRNHSTGVVCLP